MKQSLTKKIEKLFDNDNFSETLKLELTQNFELETNVKLIENISYFAVTAEEEWKTFFTRLSPFFEIGFYFENGRLQHTFLFGKLIDSTNIKREVSLPQSGLFKILRTDAKGFMRKMNISNIVSNEKMNCFYVRVDHNQAFVLMTEQAEPWLQLKIASLQKAVINQSVHTLKHKD